MLNVPPQLIQEPAGPRWLARMLLASMMSALLAAACVGPAFADEAPKGPAAHANGVRPPTCGTPNTPPCRAQNATIVPLPHPPHTPIIKG
jgi:hypothetical protein